MTPAFMAGTRRLTALCTLVGGTAFLAACGNTPTATADSDSPSVQMAVVTPPMEAGIVDLLDRWTDAWAAGDAVAFGAVYATNADFVNPLGAVLEGRAAIQATHTFLFGALFAGSQQTWELRRLVALGGNVALVDLNVELSGFQGTPPGLTVWPDNVVRTRSRMTVARNAGKWEIQSQQLTARVP